MIRTIIYFGTPCAFADLVLNRLISHGFRIAARVVPGAPGSGLPYRVLTSAWTNSSRNPVPMAAAASVRHSACPVIVVNDHSSAEVGDLLACYHADLAVVCCYPQRIPPLLFNAAQLGSVNVHPSFLPAYRGPVPLFWMFRNGELETGVTIHRLDQGLDTGPLIRQARLPVPLGTSGDRIWMESARIGAELLISALKDDRNPYLAGKPQVDSEASYFSLPRPADLTINPARWDAWRVFHFCRGVIPLGYAPLLSHGTLVRPIKSAAAYVQDRQNSRIAASGSSRFEWTTCASGAVQLELGAANR